MSSTLILPRSGGFGSKPKAIFECWDSVICDLAAPTHGCLSGDQVAGEGKQPGPQLLPFPSVW